MVPIARALIIRLPGSTGGLVWNRPVAVLVQEHGQERRLRGAEPD